MCPYSEFFLSVFSRIRTEYGQYLSEFSPNVGKTDQKNSEYGHFSRSGSHADFSHFTLIYVPKKLKTCLPRFDPVTPLRSKRILLPFSK